MKKIFIFFLLVCLQHNTSNAMKRTRNDEINSWLLSSGEPFPKKQSTEQNNIAITQKCPIPITEFPQLAIVVQKMVKKTTTEQLDSKTKKQKKQAEFAPLVVAAQQITKEQIIEQDSKTNKKHICEECKIGFARKSSLNRHKKTIHSDEKKRYNCDLCDKSFTRKDNLTVHQNTIHSGVKKQYSCDQCKGNFSYKKTLTEHQKNYCKIKPKTCRNG